MPVLLLGLIGLAVILICIVFGENRPTTCPQPDCRHRNRHNARYCARCGAPLGAEENQH